MAEQKQPIKSFKELQSSQQVKKILLTVPLLVH
jgi:hypothetical protein